MRSAGAWDEVCAASAAEGDLIARGVGQRVLAIEAFLADVYGPGRVFDDGVLPWRLLFTSAGFHREAAGIAPPNGVRVHVAGVDLIRDDDGVFRVLRQNVRGPAIPARVDPRPLLAALRAAAPDPLDPRVVVLTNGNRDPAYHEHVALARRMGVPLVEGRDLSCRRDRVYAGTEPVGVIYRYVADGWLDPLHFRPESRLGCPGLVNAARAGGVTIANAVGNGIADDPRLRARGSDLIRYYLGQEPLLAEAVPAGEPVPAGGRVPAGEPVPAGDPEAAGDRVPAREPEAARGQVLRAFAVNDGEQVLVLPA